MSRFVSAGTDADSKVPDEAWLKAQQEVEAQRKPKPSEPGQQEGGKSLYEVLQQNKAAKQEAFEESIRLKNQFRPLDEDEIEFLDSVLEADRAKENAVKQETAEQLEAFRKQRALAEQALLDQQAREAADNVDTTVSKNVWTTQKKKRRRDKDGESGSAENSKARKLSSSTNERKPVSPVSAEKPPTATSTDTPEPSPERKKSQIEAQTIQPKPAAVGLDLGDYSSDDD
ncbi:hypothetical protein ABEF95_003619 [Exophiala dermatitidis]